MKKSLLFTFFLVTVTIVSRSQSISLKGTLTDSVEKKNPANAVVSLLRQKDSVLVAFARSNKEGNFSFPNMKDGKFILMVTHPYMGDYFDTIVLQKNTEKDLGRLYMTPKSKLLAEAIVKTGSPIRIKGDTTVYTADSFKVRAGANVEELLRKLPGIQVDKDGKITAMGERVTKVLVDGEEFFGSDPGIATKNLRADAVKEVEVFDKKSDQAEFTGIDDGVKDKTINLKMKKQAGFFGKIEAGGGLKDKYDNAAMLNAFKNKRKIAAYGIMSNTGQTNLDWNDAQNYGGGIEGMESGTSDDGGMYVTFNGGDEDNFYNGQGGIPQNWNGGLHYSNKFNNNKNSFNSGYKFSKINAPALSNKTSKIFLPDSSWLENSNTNTFKSTIKHALNVTLDFNLDSSNSLKWTTKANNNNGRTSSSYYSEAIDNQSRFINNSTRSSNNNSDNNSIKSTLLWKHKFKKLSRTLSINTDLDWNKSENDGLLYSLNRYYKNGLLFSKDTTDQQNIRNSEGKAVSTKISYTEPLSKTFYVELSYLLSYNNNNNERITNTKSIGGKYDTRIDTLSNSFGFNRFVNTPGINFRMNKKKYNYSFGTAVGFSHFVQENITSSTKTNYNYTNFFPRASYTYKIKPNESLRLSYNGSSNAPSLEQLQPIRVNTDPLNVYIGNPDLKQSFRHSVNSSYSFYNILKERGFWSSLEFSMTDNAFVQSGTIDSVGKRTYKTVNGNGAYNANFFSDYNFKLQKIKLRVGLGPVLNLRRNIDFVNGVENRTTTNSYGLRLSASRQVENKFDFYINPEFSWNRSKASLNKSANVDYWKIEGSAQAKFTLPKKFELGTDVNTQIRQKDPRFAQNNNFTTWNAAITKRFFKDNAIELKLGLYDILNQNKGYQRDFNSYSFTETHYTTLRRFWLLKLTWNISKNGKPASGF